MTGRSYFVEGIQGAGKSTMVERLAKELPDYRVYREGDYSPVELAWCAYVNASEYAGILKRYQGIAQEIEDKTVREGDMYVICYTRIITDITGFHKDLEQYEIYNANRNREEFSGIVLQRFRRYSGGNAIFECSIFQNIIENMILFFEMSDEEIVDFYREVREALGEKEYRIVYLEVDDVRAAEEVIRKERSDEDGNELWFPLMIRYLEESPYARHNGLLGMDGLVSHLLHRVRLEKRILKEIFGDCSEIILRKVL